MGKNANIFPVPNNHLLTAKSTYVIIILGSEGRALELRAGYHIPLIIVIGKSYFLLLSYDLPDGNLTLFSLRVALTYSYIILFLRNGEMRDFLGSLTSY